MNSMTMADIAATAFRSTRMLIGGDLVGARSGSTMPVECPGDGSIIAQVPAAGADDVGRAVAAASAALPGWRFTDLMARRQAILDLAAAVRDNVDHIARLDAIDSGSPIRSMRRDVAGAIFYLEWVAGLAFSWGGHAPATTGTGIDLTLREPFGVTARIVPFNHPFYFACKIATPLLTGNTVVLKLPDQTPLSGLWLAEQAAALFPAGVVNIVSGHGAIAGEALVRHPGVARICFTGSVPTGRRIAQRAAERFVPVSMELGGKNPLIICADADLQDAIRAAVAGMNYSTQGQSCGSYSRVLVHESVHDAAVEMLSAEIPRVRVGHPLAEESEMGALISESARDRVEGHIGDAVSAGARIVTGGTRPDGPTLSTGWYANPTLLDSVDMSMRVAREEIFGPVQSVIRWSTEEEVIAAANATEFGLTANVHSRDIDRALHIARRVDSGAVSVNGDGTMHWPGAPFGGFKSSGVGKEDSLDEIVESTREKNLYINLQTPR